MATACDDARVTDETRATSTVEWGAGDRGGRLAALATRRWRRSLVRALAGLGALAMIGSLVAPWQLLDSDLIYGSGSGEDDLLIGPGRIAGWGMWWIFSITVLAILVTLTLLGRQTLATHTRTVGLAASVVMLIVLVAATISLRDDALFGFFPVDVEADLGRGLHLAYVTLVLFGAALWLAAPAAAVTAGSDGTGEGDPGRVRRPGAWWRDGERKGPVREGPRDLSVEPATPDTLQG
jgi:hypothetical protein